MQTPTCLVGEHSFPVRSQGSSLHSRNALGVQVPCPLVPSQSPNRPSSRTRAAGRGLLIAAVPVCFYTRESSRPAFHNLAYIPGSYFSVPYVLAPTCTITGYVSRVIRTTCNGFSPSGAKPAWNITRAGPGGSGDDTAGVQGSPTSSHGYCPSKCASTLKGFHFSASSSTHH